MLAPCTRLLCSGVTSAGSAQEASHSNSFSWHLTAVPGASPAATVCPALVPQRHSSLSSAEQLLHSSSTAALSCTGPCPTPLLPLDRAWRAPPPPLQNCCIPGPPLSTSWVHSPIDSGSSSYYYRKFQLLKDFVQKAA